MDNMTRNKLTFYATVAVLSYVVGICGLAILSSFYYALGFPR